MKIFHLILSRLQKPIKALRNIYDTLRSRINFPWVIFFRKNLQPTRYPQWTFWYCNDVGVTSPSISPWPCRYIVNETHGDVNLRYQPDIKILRLDQSDFNIVLTSSRSRMAYQFSTSHKFHVYIVATENWSFRRRFSELLLQKICKIFSNSATIHKSYF